MTTWEYLFLELPHDRRQEGKVADERVENVYQITAILNEVGSQGWKVVNFNRTVTGAGKHFAPQFLLGVSGKDEVS